MRLDGLFREEETLADLAVDETVGDELEDFELASRGFLLELAKSGQRSERDDGPRPLRFATRRSRLEAAAVVAIPRQDFPALCGVHELCIGVAGWRFRGIGSSFG